MFELSQLQGGKITLKVAKMCDNYQKLPKQIKDLILFSI
jgi:hypothetical protein